MNGKRILLTLITAVATGFGLAAGLRVDASAISAVPATVLITWTVLSSRQRQHDPHRRQVLQATGLSRDKLDTLLKHLGEVGGETILSVVPFRVPRPGVRGKPPTVYRLGEQGAALLRANGHRQTHACGYRDETDVAHALATLDVRLAAEAAELAVRTEKALPYTAPDGRETVLRPDNLVTLPGGQPALFEIEQAMQLVHLRRVCDTQRRKAAFFHSAAAGRLSSSVRVLFNLSPGPAWDSTVAVWERANAIVAEEHGGTVPFRIVALPLQGFLNDPDWGEPPDEKRWESLFDPAQTSAFAPPQPTQAGSSDTTLPAPRPPQKRALQLPQALQRRAARDDLLILEAFWQHFQEHAPSLAYTDETPRPDRTFFALMELVYTASHDPTAPAWEQATYPFASLYLLRRYLQMHPRLREALSKALRRGGGRMSWNTHTIRHRMQVVMQLFFNYHGLRPGHTLKAYPVAPWQRCEECGDFGVAVSLHPELLLGEEDGVVPGAAEVHAAEAALAWVLWALFAHSETLGLKSPPFW